MSSEHAKSEMKKSRQELKNLIVLAEVFVKFSIFKTPFHDIEIVRYYLKETERYINRIETLYSQCFEPWEGLERDVREVMTRLREKENDLFVMLDQIKRKSLSNTPTIITANQQQHMSKNSSE